MTVAVRPGPLRTRRLDLVWLSPATMRALLDGRLPDLEGAALPADWAGDIGPLLRLRLAQVERMSEHAPWLLRAIVLRDERRVLGHIGFHGAPGANALADPDAVELGYTIETADRRHGYASEAIPEMARWAREAGIRRVLISIGRDNAPSLALARALGARQLTLVRDTDGVEIVFELP